MRKSLIDALHLTLDKHHPNDCAHNTTWRTRNGQIPDPFTIVSHAAVEAGDFKPNFPFGIWEGKQIGPRQWALNYTDALEKRGRNPLCLWPQHCLIEEWGSMIYHPIQKACKKWAEATGAWINPITKGQWPWTEHYSPWIADVPDSTVLSTGMNGDALRNASQCDLAIWCGWAGSHCLKFAGLDGVAFFEPTDAEKAKGAVNQFVKKCVFLEDASAPVPNPPGGPDFEKARLDFLEEMVNRGARVMTADKMMTELKTEKHKTVHMFLIDPENDFCASGNEPPEWPTPEGGKPRVGALYVAGADREALTVAKFIEDSIIT